MAKGKSETWTCVCGRVHEIDGNPIRCSGIGHNVVINPAYWTYRTEKKKEQKGQLTLI